MKRCVCLILMAVVALSVLSSESSAAPPNYRFDPATLKKRELRFPNTWAGYKIFQNNCKTCHFRGNEKGAPFLHTESKTMRGWNRVFFEKYPQCAKDGHWASLTDEDLVKLNDYLYQNASDADNPFCAA